MRRLVVGFALACSLAGCPTASTPRAPRLLGPAGPAAPVELAGWDLGVLTADDRAAYWAADGALWRRGFTDPAPTRLAGLDDGVLALARHRDQLYALGERAVHVVAVSGGPVAELPSIPEATALAVDDDGVWLGGVDRVARIAPGERAPAVVVEGVTQVTALASDADAIYVARVTERTDAPPAGDDAVPHAIWRLGKRDGSRRLLADLQYDVRALAVDGDRLTWATGARGGVESLPVTGGEPSLALAGPVDAFAPTRGGGFVRTRSGLLAALDRGPARLLTPPPGWRFATAWPIAAAGAGVVAVLEDPARGAHALWWLPAPGPDAPAVVAWARRRFLQLAHDRDAAYFLDGGDAAVDGWPARVVRLRARAPHHKRVSAPLIEAFAVDDGAVAYFDGAALHLREPGRPPRRLTDAEQALGLVLDARAAYWIERGLVRTVARAGGVAAVLHRPDWGSGGTGRPYAELVVDGRSVFFSSLGFGASAVFHTRDGGAARTLLDAEGDGLADSLVAIGGDLFVIRGARSVWRVPMNGGPPREILTAPAGVELDALVADARHLYVATRRDGVDELALAALDPAAATPVLRPLVRLPGAEAGGPWTAVGGAVYQALPDSGWLVRIDATPGAR